MLQGMRGGDAAWNKDMFSIEGMNDMSNIQVRFPRGRGWTRLMWAYLGPPTRAKGHHGGIVSVMRVWVRPPGRKERREECPNWDASWGDAHLGA
jgi:hypothetical protein